MPSTLQRRPDCTSFLCSAAQPCLTLCNSVSYNPPGSSVRGILQARILEWVAVPFSRAVSFLGCCNEAAHTGCLKTAEVRPFTVLEAESLHSECWWATLLSRPVCEFRSLRPLGSTASLAWGDTTSSPLLPPQGLPPPRPWYLCMTSLPHKLIPQCVWGGTDPGQPAQL